jgi:cell division protein FtsW
MRNAERCSRKLYQDIKVKPDLLLLFVTAALVSVGILMVFSASPTMGMAHGDSYYYLKRHLVSVVIGLFALYAGYKTDLHLLKSSYNYLMGISILLLLLVLMPSIGTGIGGASRWIHLGFLSFQPGEFAKFALVVYLATHFSLYSLKRAAFPLGASLLTALLILKQPDLGTVIMIAVIALVAFFLAGTRSSYMLVTLGLGIVSLVAVSLAKPYRVRRLLAYLNPWSDPKGVGFHIIQSLIAVGSGGLFGLGLGQSRQKFFYLPQNYTDFIFAIFCEEMGLFGAVGVMALFFFFAVRGIRITRQAPDMYTTLLAGGLTAWITFQAMINISVVLGAIPTTGIPLPFISYGGTSLFVLLFSTGLLLNISQYRRAET